MSVVFEGDGVGGHVHLGLVVRDFDDAALAVEDRVELLAARRAQPVEPHRRGAVTAHALHVDGLEIEGFHTLPFARLGSGDRETRALDAAGGGSCCVGWAAVTDVDGFVHQFVAGADADDVAALGVDNLEAAARSLMRLGEHRHPGATVVRVANPSRARDGWESPHTVVEIVTDDAPFLVDSVSVALVGRAYDIHVLLHPRVDAAAWLHLEIDRETDAGLLAALQTMLEHVVADVGVVVDDWRPMRDRDRKSVV